ncbi:hypothetical protein ACFV4K_10125 [Nocardia sp. NPDC059764]|uniref:hypothetical protein n=1 Tax=Nocardia sp. NPDC059764 TaxID=3346939 RepID=UPI0036529FDC
MRQAAPAWFDIQTLDEMADVAGSQRDCDQHRRSGEDNERRAVSPLFWSNINLNSRFGLDMNTRVDRTRERVAG